MYDTGLRASETIALDTHHLGLDDSRLLLLGSIQKGNARSASTGLGKWGLIQRETSVAIFEIGGRIPRPSSPLA